MGLWRPKAFWVHPSRSLRPPLQGCWTAKLGRQQAGGTRQCHSGLPSWSLPTHVLQVEAENPWEFNDTPHFYSTRLSPHLRLLMFGLKFRDLGSCLCPLCCLRNSTAEVPQANASALPLSCHSVPRAVKQAEQGYQPALSTCPALQG